MNRISFRTLGLLSVLSLAVVMTLGTFTGTASAQDKLSKAQLNTLISTAKTSADHQRIADYYTAQAKDYLAQAADHKAMIVAYKANPSTKHQAAELSHCENFVASLNDLAANANEMATMHHQMANEAGAKN